MHQTSASTTARRLVVALAFTLVAAACSGEESITASGGATDGSGLGDPGNCAVVDMSVSSEKIELLTNLARTFNESGPKAPSGRCVFVRPQKKASGGAATLLSTNWDEAVEGPRPVIWSPAASSWGAVLNQRLSDAGKAAMAPEDPTSFMVTPLVIAMPKPMADALGYPDTPVGWKTIAELATNPQGWAAYGHPEWGPFRLGKTNPNFSTSGLSALIAQTYAAVGKTSDLSSEDLARADVIELGRNIESAVVHYGDITMTFLNNWFRADKRGTALTYASAVAVEEKSLIDYNLGNPDGVLDPGEEARPPKTPLVAIYPEEGTLYSDNPFFVLDADWVDADERAGAEMFGEFVQRPENQKTVLASGFRPGNPEVAIGSPIISDNGVDPDQPSTLLRVPAPKVMLDLLTSWETNRKTARVLIVLDVSGSMGEDAGNGDTKLELAKDATIEALDGFNPNDEVGLRIFTTELGPQQDQEFLDLQPLQPIGAGKERVAESIRALSPLNGTPLYSVARASYQSIFDGYDPTRINAVILLTDGVNDDGNESDDADQKQALIDALRKSANGENAKPVRLFTVAYGTGADTTALKAIAEASNAAAYTATDAASIRKVFEQVVSNF